MPGVYSNVRSTYLNAEMCPLFPENPRTPMPAALCTAARRILRHLDAKRDEFVLTP
jgi:hypothetical protein